MSASAVALLVQRDLVRLTRQPARIIASIATPALIGVFLASGFARTDAPAGAAYGPYLLAGMLVLVVIFSCIFSAIALIDDRERGILQSLIVSPLPWRSIALARLIGATVAALLQAAVLMLVAVVFGIAAWSTGLVIALAALTLVAIGTTGIGLALAWIIRSKEGFHGVMNLILMPMWLLSGAFFEVQSAARWLGTLMLLNPLTHATDALRAALLAQQTHSPSWIAAAVYAFVGIALATQWVGRPGKPGRF
jgi:ABC-2 type transport system permease protein